MRYASYPRSISFSRLTKISGFLFFHLWLSYFISFLPGLVASILYPVAYVLLPISGFLTWTMKKWAYFHFPSPGLPKTAHLRNRPKPMPMDSWHPCTESSNDAPQLYGPQVPKARMTKPTCTGRPIPKSPKNDKKARWICPNSKPVKGGSSHEIMQRIRAHKRLSYMKGSESIYPDLLFRFCSSIESRSWCLQLNLFSQESAKDCFFFFLCYSYTRESDAAHSAAKGGRFHPPKNASSTIRAQQAA